MHSHYSTTFSIQYYNITTYSTTISCTTQVYTTNCNIVPNTNLWYTHQVVLQLYGEDW